MCFGTLGKYIKGDLRGGSEFKMLKCNVFLMIILRIVMTNRGASVTDAFKKSFLWLYSLKDATEEQQCTNLNFELG